MKKKSIHFLRQQNKGAAIVIVIVAMAFVGILGSTLMWMSLVNYRMKTTDRQVKESFYDAETVFEQIIVGLQNTASDAADASYSFIMQNYSNFTEDKRNAEFQKEYLKGVRSAIAKSEAETNKYDLQKLMRYVDKNMDVTVAPEHPDAFTGSWIGAKVAENDYSSRFGDIISPTDANYIMLKGLHLEYIDQDGFVSMIDTDVMITTPDAAFTQSGRLSDVFDYAIIADRSIEKAAGSGDVTIRGNVYAGERFLENDDGTVEHTGEGIVIDAQTKFTVEKADYLISKGDVIMKQGGSLIVGGGETAGDVPEFWTQGITVEKGANKAGLTLNARTYVADDLTLNGNETTVKISGSYYGYGDSEEKAESSSAIIVNGTENTIDLSKVSQLLLAGRGYTSVSNVRLSQSDPDAKTVEIPTGESVAVKGNQVAYLVPDECIGVLRGVSVFGRNPLKGSEYAELKSYMDDPAYADSFKEVDFDRQISALQDRSLSSYGVAEVKKVFIPSNGETMVYYYLLFSSSAERARFFADYYGIHKEKLDRYANLYANGGIISNVDFTRITVAGNYLQTDDSVADGVALMLPTDSVSAGNDLTKEISNYHDTFTGLTTALSSNYLALTDEEKVRDDVFANIIDVEKLQAYLGTGQKEFKTDDGYTAVLSDIDYKSGRKPGDGADVYHYSADKSEKIRLIISTGDVQISKNFTGVIIAGGKVTIKEGVTVTSAKEAGIMSDLVRLLQQPHDNPGGSDQNRPMDFIRNVDQYVLEGTALAKDEDSVREKNIDFANFVKYQNWTKK